MGGDDFRQRNQRDGARHGDHRRNGDRGKEARHPATRREEGERPRVSWKRKAPSEPSPETPFRERRERSGSFAEGDPEHHFISAALDSDILAGRERMKTFSLITITERRGGAVDTSDITDVLSCLVDEHWQWEVKPLREGRFITAFPSAELARRTEAAGPLRVLRFTIELEPWTPDLWKTGRAEGATRWVIVKNMPMDCWNRDTVARLLKPAGDLVAVSNQSRTYGNDLKILLRVRRPRKCQHIFTVVWAQDNSAIFWRWTAANQRFHGRR
ncbi:hypothetical protein J5N97_006333 [Dioscorea zingiberensis]|uniref:DUF4283 domain-containing protein n=1 Tax=Dioscorea zingiberensis TaxID=325984 RepID=A0A9D5HTX5_9LILI|nr:hypothetical protein J5N97_006333 [Dioscorea zingiberensis]